MQGGRGHTKDKDHDTEAFKTFIIRFIGTDEFSFHNVDKPQDGHGESAELEPNDPQDGGMALYGNESDEDHPEFKPQRTLIKQPSSPVKKFEIDSNSDNNFKQSK